MKVHCPYDRLVSTKELKPHPKNRNSHPKEQLERLAQILDYQGWRYPVKVSKQSGFITSGHGRLEAAKLLKLKEVPVSFQDYTDEAQEYADLTADNAIASWSELDLSGINSDMIDLGPDFDIDLLGIKDFVIEPVEKLEPGCDEDDVPEARPDPKVVRGEVYILGNHRLMCGDSTAITDVERLMNGEKADMVFTDPPYGIGIDGQKKSVAKNPKHNRKGHDFRGWDSEIPHEDFFQILHGMNIPSIVFGANYMIEHLTPSKGWIYWGKGQDGQLTASDGELAWSNIDKPLRAVKCNRAKIGKSVHPTQKPTEVVEFCLNYVDGSKKVIDFFGGSGSTLIACEKTDRQCFMMELDPRYCGVILDRWQKYTGKKAHREDGVAWDEIKAQ
mgnify:CR=1 FL=1|jgi:16S rRNA G966 N2-methylase RsmD